MKTWKLVTVLAASLSAVAFSAACTVSEDTGTAGAGGSAGTPAQPPTAGTGGTPAVGGAAGMGGAVSPPTTFAEAFSEDPKVKTDCEVCLDAKCAADVKACGDVFGAGACSKPILCIGESKETDFNCAISSCVNASATDPVNSPAINSAFACMSDNCAAACKITPGFTGPTCP